MAGPVLLKVLIILGHKKILGDQFEPARLRASSAWRSRPIQLGRRQGVQPVSTCTYKHMQSKDQLCALAVFCSSNLSAGLHLCGPGAFDQQRGISPKRAGRCYLNDFLRSFGAAGNRLVRGMCAPRSGRE
ncbi:Unknown protein sequence [Pseudomonas syringae pv. syringae]|nr:Unknown protein sequence [Pseudomonas syringae pv. syringae]